MSWLSSIFISLLSGALGLVCGGIIMSFCASWYRVSNFEGAAGYAVVAVAVMGAVAGLVIGGIATRIVAAGASPGFFKGLGAAWGTTLSIALVALGIARLRADLAPKMDGRRLELEIEVRCPKGFQVPPVDQYGATAAVYLSGKSRQPFANLQLEDTNTVDGHRIVSAKVPLSTSSSHKYLEVRFSKEHDLLFNLPLRSHPKASDREWSQWIESAWEASKPEPTKEAKFNARYRVRTVEPPPPEPDPAEVRAREFAALKPDAPLEAWLPFLFESPADDRTRIVIQRIEERQGELPELIRSTNATLREYALRATAYPQKPAPEVTEAVLAEGREIAASIRQCNTMSADDPAYIDALVDLRSRFNYWKQAWWGLSRRLGLDGRPPVKEIHDLAKMRAPGTAMDEIEVNARVILEALNKSAAEQKP